MQASSAFARSQVWPQAAQFDCVPSCTSQPLEATLSQSDQPGSQAATRHPPALQVERAWGSAQALSQRPQCAGLLVVSTHPVPHSVWPFAHSAWARVLPRMMVVLVPCPGWRENWQQESFGEHFQVTGSLTVMPSTADRPVLKTGEPGLWPTMPGATVKVSGEPLPRTGVRVTLVGRPCG